MARFKLIGRIKSNNSQKAPNNANEHGLAYIGVF